jgi:hypothetical protein
LVEEGAVAAGASDVGGVFGKVVDELGVGVGAVADEDEGAFGGGGVA